MVLPADHEDGEWEVVSSDVSDEPPQQEPPQVSKAKRFGNKISRMFNQEKPNPPPPPPLPIFPPAAQPPLPGSVPPGEQERGAPPSAAAPPTAPSPPAASGSPSVGNNSPIANGDFLQMNDAIQQSFASDASLIPDQGYPPPTHRGSKCQLYFGPDRMMYLVGQGRQLMPRSALLQLNGQQLPFVEAIKKLLADASIDDVAWTLLRWEELCSPGGGAPRAPLGTGLVPFRTELHANKPLPDVNKFTDYFIEHIMSAPPPQFESGQAFATQRSPVRTGSALEGPASGPSPSPPPGSPFRSPSGSPPAAPSSPLYGYPTSTPPPPSPAPTNQVANISLNSQQSAPTPTPSASSASSGLPAFLLRRPTLSRSAAYYGYATRPGAPVLHYPPTEREHSPLLPPGAPPGASPAPSLDEASFTEATKECSICACDVNAAEMFLLGCPSEHEFCVTCLRHYLEVEVDNNHTVQCPAVSCSHEFTLDEVRTICLNAMDEGLLDRYQSRVFMATLNTMEDVVWCPRCTNPIYGIAGAAQKQEEGEEGAAEGEDGDMLTFGPPIGAAEAAEPPKENAKEKSKEGAELRAQCPHCAYLFCSGCMGPFHFDFTCYQYSSCRARQAQRDLRNDQLSEADKALLQAQAETEEWKRANSVPCPMCRVPIEKNGGCCHMKCTGCRHQFCWDCMRTWSEHQSDTAGCYRRRMGNREGEIKALWEEREREQAERDATTEHENVVCDNCLAHPLIGRRYVCMNCPSYNLCERCEKWKLTCHVPPKAQAPSTQPSSESTPTPTAPRMGSFALPPSGPPEDIFSVKEEELIEHTSGVFETPSPAPESTDGNHPLLGSSESPQTSQTPISQREMSSPLGTSTPAPSTHPLYTYRNHIFVQVGPNAPDLPPPYPPTDAPPAPRRRGHCAIM